MTVRTNESRATADEMVSRHEEAGYSYLWWQLIILGTNSTRLLRLRVKILLTRLFHFSEALAWTTLFPCVIFMMQSFLADEPGRDAQAASYASLTVALFTFGEFCTGFLWAKLSDSIGRKPTLMIGVVGGCVSALAFGLSTNLWIALAARLFGGMMNPNVAVVSTCVGELVKKKEYQGRAFSIVPFLRGLGSLVGPIIGGHLPNPVTNLPSLFNRGTIWQSFPYLLPNLIVVLFVSLSGLLGFFFLDESYPQMRKNADIGRVLSKWLTRKTTGLFGIVISTGYAPLYSEDVTTALALRRMSLDDCPTDESESSRELCMTSGSKETRQSPYTARVMLQIMAVSLLAFHKVSSDVIIPTFLATPSVVGANSRTNFFKFDTGFDMESPSIANVLLSQAIVVIIAQSFIVPPIVDRFGPLRTFRWSNFVFPWLYFLTPFASKMPHPLSLMLLLLDLWTKGILVNLGYVCSAILLTETAPSPGHLAAINGLAASVGCLARSIGAAVSGSMFHEGLMSGYIGLPFWTLAGIATGGAILSFFLDDKP